VGDVVIGTIRIDLRPEGSAVFRLVAIDTPWQGQGLGTIMLEMAENYAWARGAGVICLNSVPDAFRFYARRGFNPARWDGCTRNETEIPVMKEITSEPMRLVA
jgi:GNAT superfamily N-acetyltransferase